MYLASLHIYPIKGCRGIALDAAEVDALGLVGDRRFMIVDAIGKFLTQRTHPRMALIATALDGEKLTLSAPGMDTSVVVARHLPTTGAYSVRLIKVEIWKDQHLSAEDCGDNIAAWLTHYLQTPVRLVRIGPAFNRPVKPEKARPGDVVTFADGYPFLAISQASLDALNARLVTLGEMPLPMDRFRPNIVIADCLPHAEDDAAHICINDFVLRSAGPCARCIVTTTNQQTAERGHEPLRTLATYRRDSSEPTKINFGQNLIHETKTGTLRVGDKIVFTD